MKWKIPVYKSADEGAPIEWVTVEAVCVPALLVAAGAHPVEADDQPDIQGGGEKCTCFPEGDVRYLTDRTCSHCNLPRR